MAYKFFAWKNLSSWSKGKHSWLWILQAHVGISVSPTIFPMKKKRCDRDLNTGPQNPKSAMLAPRPQIDEKCMENQKIFGWALSNPKFTHYLIMKYETYSSKICGILETILSSSFLPCSSILVWKLMVWIDWETPRPPRMGNRVNGKHF